MVLIRANLKSPPNLLAYQINVIVGQRHKVGFIIADSTGRSSAQQAEEPRDEPKP